MTTLIKAPLLAALAAIGATISGATVASAADPSFDCARALGSVEYKICTTQVLAARDQEMATLYGSVKSRIRPRSDISYLVADQKRWLAHRDSCWSKRCIARAYDQRIDTLTHYAVIRDD